MPNAKSTSECAGLRDVDMRGLRVRGFTVAQLLQQRMPELSEHLAEYLRNDLSLLLTEWLLTLFASSVPLGPVASLWDRFFEEGYVAIYRLALARLRCLQPWLRAETDFASLVHLIKEAHVEFDCSSGEPQPLLPAGEVQKGSDLAAVARSKKNGLITKRFRPPVGGGLGSTGTCRPNLSDGVGTASCL
ncbi:unnamed protein product [Prorocentrum cordatum]|uniref:Rab-GAP TBC domain-containing protein n=1 Tax=Prorocentrum cordatum TaxID=2364126 RepID=A0ABN9PX04_9DINO|nr:unnamed protein product [Polarella glacialis]